MSSDASVKIWDETINRKLFELTHSQNTAEAYGGLMAIVDYLLGTEPDETIEAKRNLFRFYNYVKHLLPNHEVSLMLYASKTLGRIAEIGGSAFGERFMDYEVQAAIDLIQPDKNESPRHAGVLILKELARNSPTYFHQHIDVVFENILIPLRDPRVHIREGAAELLAACLEIITTRERQTRSPYFSKILQDAHQGLKGSSMDIVHGSLLTYRELLLHAGMFMKESYLDITEQILRYKSHRDPLIRKMVITMIPSLAVYDTQTFTEHFLHKAMGHLLTQLEKPAERNYAFIAIGHTANAIGSDMKPFLDSIMNQIKIGLQGRGRKNAPNEEPLFQCMGMLAAAVGPNLTKLLHDQLDLMMSCGLSEPLKNALAIIAKHIPPLLQTIQDRLLDLLSQVLSGQPYKSLGAPTPTVRQDNTGIMSNVPPQVSASVRPKFASHDKSPELITLALTTLGSFDFNGHVLNEFVRNCAVPYLEDDQPEVRRAAALTCCRLLVCDPICYQSSSHAIEIISDVLDKLLTVGIADPDSSIRQTVLGALHEKFDKHLAQAENVRSLFIALNDEVFENRMIAVGLIGRLARHNPAYVMPSLRKALIQLLTELEYSTVLRSREECTRLLTLLVSCTQRFIKPYALPILRVMLQKANDVNPTISANVLMCLGELVSIAGEDALIYVPDMMAIIIQRLSDPSVIKRDAALHALGQLCSSTGYVITPLVDYPQLVPLLSSILRSDGAKNMRREVVKVLGILGALDPYRRKVRSVPQIYAITHSWYDQTRPDDESMSEKVATAVNQVPAVQFNTVSGADDYFQMVVINALLAILKDQALSSHHHTVIDAVMSIFKTQGLKCVAFLPQIIPAFTSVARTASVARLQEFHLQQLAILVGIIKQQVRNYMPEIFALITELWEHSALQLPIVVLIEALGIALDAEFKPFLPTILSLILKVFEGGPPDDKRSSVQIKVFDAFLTFGSNIEEYLHLVIPIIVKTYERDGSTQLRKKAVQTINGLARSVNFSDHASRIIHPLVRVLDNSNTELRISVMEALCSLMMQLGADFAIFVPTINKSIMRNKVVPHHVYENMINKLLNGEPLPQDMALQDSLEPNKITEFSAPAEASKMTVNQQHLKQAWDVSLVATREDWFEWIHRLTCMGLVDIHPPLAKELFNAAFLSCWSELYDQYQEDLVRSVEHAITSNDAPPELIHRLLNLAEFMEHEEKPLPIEHRTLGEYAMKYMAYAKALHYKELEYFSEASPAVVESLISINTRLQQHDAAWGTLITAKEQYNVTEHEEWYERLGRWQDALVAYEKAADNDPSDLEVQYGRMKCLHALGEWEQLATRVNEHWATASHDDRRDIAPMAAAAAWTLNAWDDMEDYVNNMKSDSPDRAFYKAILFVQQNQFPKALSQIAKARDSLDPELSSFVGDSYGQLYGVMVRAQMLSELEEIIAFKQYADQPERQLTMRKTWLKRLQGCQPDVEIWQRILQVRTLVLNPEDDPVMWIKFANLCRKNDRMPLAEKTINSLLSPERATPNVVYAHLKYMWAQGSREESLEFLRRFTEELAHDLSQEVGEPSHQLSMSISKQKLTELSKLLARCYYKQGEWQAKLGDDWGTRNTEDILHAYYLATHYDATWYKAWHTWALTNFEVVSELEAQAEGRTVDIPGEGIAICYTGFFRSIALKNFDALQDLLRLLTLWFKFGAHDDVSDAMANGFSTVEVDTWLEVIPQIIARIQTPSINIRRTISNLLTDVGKNHPQALIYPLTVASKSSSVARMKAAQAIMDRMGAHSPLIVNQAQSVSQELIRVAILWHELWHEALEEASRLYFTEKNPDGMMATLEPLHDLLKKGPRTARETSFVQAFGRELHEAREACRRFRNYGETAELDRAWDIYYGVFKRVDKQLPQLTSLDLQYVSPILLRSRNLELAVPGTYLSGRPIIRIHSFTTKLTVITSKKRPRRLCLKGDDGRDYQYILKGHEDLRQDERVMQLFGLVNTLLSVDTNSFKRRLHIQRYPVIPLAPNAGLLGTILDSDTMHVLVRDYRDSRKVLLNIEHRLMLQMAPDYENLTLLQKVEVFEYALSNTSGQDLYRILWLKSTNSEHWLERRATYTRSLAVNSMVGHILGLGDRHPANLMLVRSTGKLVHIDFGDCFEVAMHREKFPEKVPFRLTRMLTHAMEVSGIEGSFRNTCEITMKVLRDNKDSLLAVLEAFVYDPLINWRLMQTEGEGRRNEEAQGEPGAQEIRNERALFVFHRVQHKLTGRDFNPEVTLAVRDQVEKLIGQATALENLCQCYSGWCAYW
ncbi:hypothetical protein AGABI2DRAFT_151451 [Agaricus bisporus var. bisporus H97]|uniref:hypothetical protein n=1 Tax=Agaricus bisporus var. bisporus (strain H97 / ATCC MYA-4626 / FGSC 10389) TaxID=936046 RepID=UPI00029F7D2C|nr:hypothetical protein AGABI2DRAFT_151451 [Agaricus bisporus var. bisporus H97]EKV46505.1 hypothetical protein AGABI2DRAFT_151451 [Agaricus bisporus var. bisporus H97]